MTGRAAPVRSRRAGLIGSLRLSLLIVLLALAPRGSADEPPSLERCQALLTSAPRERDTARCFFSSAGAETEPGPATAALTRIASDRPDLPWFSFYFGNYNWTRTEIAERSYARAAEVFQATGDDEGEVLARTNRSMLLTRLGKVDEANAEVSRILAVTGRSTDPSLQIQGKLTLARQLHETGRDLDRAYELLAGLEIPDDLEDAFSLQRDRLTWLGSVAVMIGRFGEARSAFERQLRMALERGDDYLEANARFHLARVAYEQLREAPQETAHRRAVSLAEEALTVATEAGHRGIEARSAWMLASLLPGPAGRQYLERCLAAAESDDLVSLCLNPLAVRVAPTDPEEARRMIERSLRLARASGEAWSEVRAWQEGMRVAWLVEPFERALSSSWEAIETIEGLRDRQPPGSAAQAGMFSIWSDDYAWLAGRLLRSTEAGPDSRRAVTEAFRVQERMRGRALASWLRHTSSEIETSDAAASPALEDIRSSLDPDEALLSFQVAPWEDLIGDFAGGSWLMTITRDGVTIHRLPGRVELRTAVRIFEGLIARRDGAEAGAAGRLYDDLLADALAELPDGIERLILVPDDALHRLPFAALRASADGEPLGVRYELVQVPSATLWLRWRRQAPERAAEPLLVLADPELPGGDGDAVPVQVAAIDRDGASFSGLGRLPYAQREGKAAVRALGGGVLLTDASASEAALERMPLHDYAVVHFAAHAVTDDDHPERSAVLLAPSTTGGAADGYLRSAEIAHLDLGGRTVVLASCRSGSGDTLRGEGVMSLARAFFQGRAHAVVASLWPLRDDESAVMFGRFYRHLGRGETVAAALRAARREAIEAGEPAAAWAGLVVLGDGSVTPLPGGRRSLLDEPAAWGVVLALLAVAATLLAVAVHRRSRTA